MSGYLIAPESVGAFFGAFFAFVFGLVTYRITKKKERWKKHQKAVVELEYLLNEHLNTISRNKYLGKGSQSIIKKSYFTYNRFSPFRIPQDLELRLADIDLINRSFGYKESILKINNDFESWNRSNEILREVVLSGKISLRDVKVNTLHLLIQLEAILNFLNGVQNKTEELLAYVRLYLLVHANLYTKATWKIFRLGNWGISEQDIKGELRVLKEEIRETQKLSREEIKKMLSESSEK